jgi:hypothetical protein
MSFVLDLNSALVLIGCELTSIIRSPRLRPASAAGLSGVTSEIKAPFIALIPKVLAI